MTARIALCCSAVLLLAPLPARAQAASGGVDGARMTEALRYGFDEVNGWVKKAAEVVPADRWDYRPVDTVRTFGELVAHVADGYAYYCGRAADPNVQWSDAIEKGSTDKAAVTAALERAAATCTAAHGSAGANPVGLMANIAHTNLHYGNMVTYMRMLGLVPPSS